MFRWSFCVFFISLLLYISWRTVAVQSASSDVLYFFTESLCNIYYHLYSIFLHNNRQWCKVSFRGLFFLFKSLRAQKPGFLNCVQKLCDHFLLSVYGLWFNTYAKKCIFLNRIGTIWTIKLMQSILCDYRKVASTNMRY